MRRQLKASGHTTPDKLFVAAPELWEDRGGSISAVQPLKNKGGGNRGNSHKARSKSKACKSNWRKKSQSRSPSPCRSTLRDYPDGNRLCAYPWTFGSRVIKCNPGCCGHLRKTKKPPGARLRSGRPAAVRRCREIGR